MNLELTNIGKKYNKDWIFRGINLTLKTNERYAVLGSNGSGKSTFLKLVAGYNIPSEGAITYGEISPDEVYKKVSIAAPYLDIYTDYTLREIAAFHQGLKPFFSGISTENFIDKIELKQAADKPLKNFSSGMLQRVKLGLAILSDTPLLLLDEPASNLDKKAINWYNKLLSEFLENRLILIASNSQSEEFQACSQALKIEDYKS